MSGSLAYHAFSRLVIRIEKSFFETQSNCIRVW